MPTPELEQRPVTIGSVDPGNQGALCALRQVGSEVIVLDIRPMPLVVNKPKTTKKTTKKSSKSKKGSSPKIDEKEVREIFQYWKDDFGIEMIVLEKQQKNRSFGGNLISGRAASGTTMEQYGLLRGICVGLDIPYYEVSPSKWLATYPTIEIPEHIQSLNLIDTKKRSIALANKYFPDESLFKNSRCRVPSDAFSDALLIGRYYLNLKV